MFQLLMMLENRPYVSLQDLSRECDISKRQLYRYLNILSSHNISIYYDKNYRGYKLRAGGTLSFTKLTAIEEVYLTAPTVFFMLHQEGETVFKEIFMKMKTNLKKESKTILENLIDRITSSVSFEEFYKKLHYVILEYAIEFKTSLLIWNYLESNVIKVNSPNLVFENIWLLQDLENKNINIELQDVKKIDFIV